ncbi:ankyrin repeat-containing domain protein [Thelephora terrestris]|uniref:Ankyrin repeat-containing domain protein n=1 Tax=Thelephora terrestris TaxID=56493 RepID=A0A9P6HHA3_9AGAM|nr:ankyrin repeat-containing domain protein [Thelephora terrestris]
MENEGASNNERLLAAAKSNNEDMLLEVFDEPGTFNVNYQDGLGNTALHYAVSHHSDIVLEHLLCHEECDVDPINRLEKATPLHLAVKIEDPEVRAHFVESLLDAGANDMIRNRYGQTAYDLVASDDEATLSAFRICRANKDIDEDDIAYEDEDDVADDSD